jgi:hypothetical protein
VIGSHIGKFAGVPDLADRLSKSEEVQKCVTRAWFRYAYARAESEEEACMFETLDKRFEETGRRPLDLLIDLTQTGAFRYRSTIPSQATEQ